MITEGTVAFCNLSETEKYQGQDTGRYSVVISIEDDDAESLEELGINLKEYEGKKQRKFVTKFSHFPVLDLDGEVTSKHIPYGSKIRVLWEPSQPHPTWGVSPYLQKVKVLELADTGDVGDEEGF